MRHLLVECAIAVVAKPGRSVMTMLGVALGVGTFVAVVGLANTASSQIVGRFDSLAATTVTAVDARGDARSPFPFPADTDRRVAALHGVTGAGVVWHQATAGAILTGGFGVRATTSFDLYAVSAGAWGAVRPHLTQGRLYDRFADQRSERVVVLGESVARRLGITTVLARPTIQLDGVPFEVVGIIDRSVREPEVAIAIAMPRGTVESLWGAPGPKLAARIVVATRMGAAAQVAREVVPAVAPTVLDGIDVIAPPDPRSLRDQVSRDLGGLLTVLALIGMLVAALGIANTTLVAVVERTAEIGLRRALGARPVHIAAQVVCESAALGGIGGLAGTTGGIVTIIAVALLHQWTAVMSPALLAAAPVIGLLVGALAGLYPALRAARIEPTTALRR